MTERKKDSVTKSDAIGMKPETIPDQQQETANGNLLGFEAPAKLDYWFNSQLMQMYSEVVSEPLPKELLDLLERLREKTRDNP
jgi:hypothetical protein